jgi:hypothetical protein
MGGWPGAFVAQRRLRHKCVKRKYQIVFWLIVADSPIRRLRVPAGMGTAEGDLARHPERHSPGESGILVTRCGYSCRASRHPRDNCDTSLQAPGYSASGARYSCAVERSSIREMDISGREMRVMMRALRSLNREIGFIAREIHISGREAGVPQSDGAVLKAGAGLAASGDALPPSGDALPLSGDGLPCSRVPALKRPSRRRSAVATGPSRYSSADDSREELGAAFKVRHRTNSPPV